MSEFTDHRTGPTAVHPPGSDAAFFAQTKNVALTIGCAYCYALPREDCRYPYGPNKGRALTNLPAHETRIKDARRVR